MDQPQASRVISPKGIPSEEEGGPPTIMASYPHWQYFLSLESDLQETGRSVEFHRDNFTAYSIEFARLLLTACSEIDVVAKLLCKSLNQDTSADDITQYRSEIMQAYPQFPTIKVFIHRYALLREPWHAWGQGKSPDWWHTHNKVKHQRDLHFPGANLQNALDSVAGLWCLLLYFYKDALFSRQLKPLPKLFHLEKEPGYLMLEQNYELPDLPKRG